MHDDRNRWPDRAPDPRRPRPPMPPQRQGQPQRQAPRAYQPMSGSEPGLITHEHAPAAYEDSSFETNSGFDVTGILRAVYNQVTGGSGGGSTISQQYIKKATDNDAPTLTRKWTELAKSFKMNQTYEKKDIITAYLNIIYFGRGAYGVGAASQAFFHKDAKDLSFSEAALLAGLIQQPGRSENDKVAHDRWNTALDRMVKNHYITAADRAAAQFPTPIPVEDSKQQAGAPPAFIVQQVKDELAAHDIPED